jgi:serine protease Do
MAKDLLPQLKKGKVVRGWLGVVIQKITPELKEKFRLKDEKGALVADVTNGGPAEKAGIQRGDVIASFNGKQIDEMNDLPFIVGSTPVGTKVDVDVIRKGRKKTFKVELGELKEQEEPKEVAKAEPELGMTVEEITPQLAESLGLSQNTGLVVMQVERNSAAEEAGLKQGDIILEIDQVPAKDLKDFLGRIRKYSKGDTILFLINRGGRTLYLTLKIS